MIDHHLDWKGTLLDIFAGYINQDPLGEALEQLAQQTSCDALHHASTIYALDTAIAGARTCSDDVLPMVDRSGYSLHSAEQAMELLNEVRQTYALEYSKLTRQ
ncbi:hypothetical protein L0938_05690 [Paracidovorax citrulli]